MYSVVELWVYFYKNENLSKWKVLWQLLFVILIVMFLHKIILILNDMIQY